MQTQHLYGHSLRWFILGAIGLEMVWYLLIQKRSYPWREMASSFGVLALRIPLRLLSSAFVGSLAFYLWSHRLATIPVNTAWGMALLFLAVEFAYYWMHRCSHEVRWLWASHLVHHTPEHIHLASAFRISGAELLSGTWLFHLPLYLLGFNPLAVSGMLAINLFYQFWLHTDLVGRLGPLEWVLNTPSHHRVHHASNPEYLDRNYGGILIIWDRLFGTFAGERRGNPITYGLVHPIGSVNPIKILGHGWIAIARDARRARSWRELLRQLIGAPDESLSSVPPALTHQMVAAGAK